MVWSLAITASIAMFKYAYLQYRNERLYTVFTIKRDPY